MGDRSAVRDRIGGGASSREKWKDDADRGKRQRNRAPTDRAGRVAILLIGADASGGCDGIYPSISV